MVKILQSLYILSKYERTKGARPKIERSSSPFRADKMGVMNWIEFQRRYGTNTTNNIELTNWARQLKVKPFKCVMRDEVKDLPQYGYFIINIQTAEEPGAHWSSVYSNPTTVYFFDSYALPPYEEVIEKFNHTKNRYSGDYHEQIQTFDKKYCGQMALFFLYRMSKAQTKSLEDFKNIFELLK